MMQFSRDSLNVIGNTWIYENYLAQSFCFDSLNAVESPKLWSLCLEYENAEFSVKSS